MVSNRPTPEELLACENNRDLQDRSKREGASGCYNYFARDRSLSAPDWKLVIPNLDDNQAWLFGKGIAEIDKPEIQDIVLYFRYNAQSVPDDD